MIGSYRFSVAILGFVVWSMFLAWGSAPLGKKHNLRISRTEIAGSSSTPESLRSSKVPAGGSEFTISTNTGDGVSGIAAAGRYGRSRAAQGAKGFDMNSHATSDLAKVQGGFGITRHLSGLVASMAPPPTTAPLLLTESDSTRAIALESTTWYREPFVPTTLTSLRLGSDRQTRISLFAMNVGPSFGDPTASSIEASAEDFAHNRYPLLVEYAGDLPGYPWLKMVTMRLNENLGLVGDVLISVHAHGQTSNRVRVGIGFVGSGLPDDSAPTPVPVVSSIPVSLDIPTITGFESRYANGYIKTDGNYFSEIATVTLSVAGEVVQGVSAEPGGFFEFFSAPIGGVLTAVVPGYSFESVTVDSDSSSFIINGTSLPTPTVTPTPTPAPTPAPTPSPTSTPTPAPTPAPTSTPTPAPTPSPTSTPTPTPTQTSRGCDYYVSTNGSSSNPGTIGSPWSLAYAFGGADGKITPGKTICLRSGDYLNTSGWTIDPSVDGTSSNPITFRNYPGERATLDTGSGTTNRVLVLNGDYNWIVGLEIMNSSTSPGPLDSGDGISHGTATGNKVIDCIIHDNTGNGIGAFSALTDFEAYGNVLYYNGKTPNNGNNNAYNIYTQNTGPLGKTYRSNALFHCFGNYPAHMYGTRNMDNLYWYNNAGTNYHNGKWWLIDSGVKAQNFVFQNNYLYGQDQLPGIFDLGADGFGAGTNGASVTGNYFGWGMVSMNTLNSGTNFTNNTLYFGGLLQFASNLCSTCTSFTGNSFTTSRPGTNWGPFVTPNSYEPGRAMVVIYNWQNLDSVAVDFSTFLNVGDSYEIRDAQNYYGALIGSGTYSGGTVSISTTSTALATPTAVPSNRPTPTHTAKEYQVWIVIRTSQP